MKYERIAQNINLIIASIKLNAFKALLVKTYNKSYKK